MTYGRHYSHFLQLSLQIDIFRRFSTVPRIRCSRKQVNLCYRHWCTEYLSGGRLMQAPTFHRQLDRDDCQRIPRLPFEVDANVWKSLQVLLRATSELVSPVRYQQHNVNGSCHLCHFSHTEQLFLSNMTFFRRFFPLSANTWQIIFRSYPPSHRFIRDVIAFMLELVSM